jgi:hypothetical protein
MIPIKPDRTAARKLQTILIPLLLLPVAASQKLNTSRVDFEAAALVAQSSSVTICKFAIPAISSSDRGCGARLA